MWITVKDPDNNTHWRVHASLSTVKRYDNYCLVSIGWTVGVDLPRRTFNRLSKTQLTEAEWGHSGCQSYCVLRGDSKCQW